MPLSIATAVILASRCAPSVAPLTIVSIARVESALDPLAIGVNGPRPSHISPPTRDAAIRQVRELIAAGTNVDLGLTQINSRNLGRLRLSIEAAFDPCLNLAAAARMLQIGYVRGDPTRIGPQQALRVALSYYNTGRASRGFANGYVARVVAAAGSPSLQPPSVALRAPPPAWDVFARAAPQSDAFVVTPSAPGDLR